MMKKIIALRMVLVFALFSILSVGSANADILDDTITGTTDMLPRYTDCGTYENTHIGPHPISPGDTRIGKGNTYYIMEIEESGKLTLNMQNTIPIQQALSVTLEPTDKCKNAKFSNCNIISHWLMPTEACTIDIEPGTYYINVDVAPEDMHVLHIEMDVGPSNV